MSAEAFISGLVSVLSALMVIITLINYTNRRINGLEGRMDWINQAIAAEVQLRTQTDMVLSKELAETAARIKVMGESTKSDIATLKSKLKEIRAAPPSATFGNMTPSEAGQVSQTKQGLEDSALDSMEHFMEILEISPKYIFGNAKKKAAKRQALRDFAAGEGKAWDSLNDPIIKTVAGAVGYDLNAYMPAIKIVQKGLKVFYRDLDAGKTDPQADFSGVFEALPPEFIPNILHKLPPEVQAALQQKLQPGDPATLPQGVPQTTPPPAEIPAFPDI